MQATCGEDADMLVWPDALLPCEWESLHLILCKYEAVVDLVERGVLEQELAGDFHRFLALLVFVVVLGALLALSTTARSGCGVVRNLWVLLELRRVVGVVRGGPLLASTASARYPPGGFGFGFSNFMNFFHQLIDDLEIDVGVALADVVVVQNYGNPGDGCSEVCKKIVKHLGRMRVNRARGEWRGGMALTEEPTLGVSRRNPGSLYMAVTIASN